MTSQSMTRIYDIGSLILDCACNGLLLTENGCPERKCFAPGAAAEAVNCCEGQGQLTVVLTEVYPSQQFPTPAVGSPGNCDVPWTVARYTVDILRCTPVGTVQRAPSCEQLDKAARMQMIDAEGIRTGIACCFRDEDVVKGVAGNGYHWSFGRHITVGPEGGCAGSRLEVLVGYVTKWCCS